MSDCCFNSRSPSGLRPEKKLDDFFVISVSIHAAQAGCDSCTVLFLPDTSVSIHAAQAGCDKKYSRLIKS